MIYLGRFPATPPAPSNNLWRRNSDRLPVASPRIRDEIKEKRYSLLEGSTDEYGFPQYPAALALRNEKRRDFKKHPEGRDDMKENKSPAANIPPPKPKRQFSLSKNVKIFPVNDKLDTETRGPFEVLPICECCPDPDFINHQKASTLKRTRTLPKDYSCVQRASTLPKARTQSFRSPNSPPSTKNNHSYTTQTHRPPKTPPTSSKTPSLKMGYPGSKLYNIDENSFHGDRENGRSLVSDYGYSSLDDGSQRYWDDGSRSYRYPEDSEYAYVYSHEMLALLQHDDIR